MHRTLVAIDHLANASAFLKGNGARIVKCEERTRMDRQYIEIAYESLYEIPVPDHYRNGGTP